MTAHRCVLTVQSNEVHLRAKEHGHTIGADSIVRPLLARTAFHQPQPHTPKLCCTHVYNVLPKNTPHNNALPQTPGHMSRTHLYKAVRSTCEPLSTAMGNVAGSMERPLLWLRNAMRSLMNSSRLHSVMGARVQRCGCTGCGSKHGRKH